MSTNFNVSFRVVPRELEDYSNYDIPVTGHWSQEELNSISETLSLILKM